MKARRLPARSAQEQLLHQVPQRRPRLLLLPPALLNRLRLLHQLVFGAIKSITLDNGSEFKSDAFLFFAPDFVFVDDGSKSAADLRQAEDNTSDAPAAAPASTPATQPAPAAQPAAPAANADGLSNEDALLVDFLIGKTLNDDVANADDTFALPKGTEITREIALDAKKHDALLLLTMSVD